MMAIGRSGLDDARESADAAISRIEDRFIRSEYRRLMLAALSWIPYYEHTDQPAEAGAANAARELRRIAAAAERSAESS